MLKIKQIDSQTGEVTETILSKQTEFQTEWLMGRHPSCPMVLKSPEVSRIHGRIVCKNGDYCFTDLGSTDGSRLNNQEVQVNECWSLKPDDTIRIGRYLLLIEEIELTHQPSFVNPSDRIRGTNREVGVRCVNAIAETADVKTFVFIAEDGIPWTYQPGQFVTLSLQIDGKTVRRSYSISSSPSRPHTLEITVKRVAPATAELPPGLVSNWLHDQITIGSEIKISPPMGQFTCGTEGQKKLLLISAGSGITPMMSMSRWIGDTGDSRDIIFIHSARSPDDIIFRRELEGMVGRYPHFKLAFTVTRVEPGQVWSGYQGRLNESMLEAIAPDLCDRTAYLCGPHPFMESVKSMLQTLNFPMNQYHEESFGGKKSSHLASEAIATNTALPSVALPSLSAPLETFNPCESTVIFAKSARTVICDGEDSILEIAEREGLDLPFGCRIGSCGVCKQKLIEGSVNYDNNPDCEIDCILTCVAKPVGRVAIHA